MKKVFSELKRLFNAYTYSWNGLKSAFRTEVSFRQDLIVFILGTLISFFLPISNLERALILFSLVLILLMELVNTAIEVIIDRVSPKYHPLSGRAKDIGSSLVLIAFINAIMVWCLILF